jgi:hypothetical protein
MRPTIAEARAAGVRACHSLLTLSQRNMQAAPEEKTARRIEGTMEMAMSMWRPHLSVLLRPRSAWQRVVNGARMRHP